MKLTFFLATCCMAVVFIDAQSSSVSVNHTKAVDKLFLDKQRVIFDILLRIDEDLMFIRQLPFFPSIYGTIKTDKSLYTQYTRRMEEFVNYYKMGKLLPKGKFFSSMQRIHIIQGCGLFHFFYYAKDWDAFFTNVIWARVHVNEGMFVHALTLAVIHREDMQGIIMPQIYEIFPKMFFPSEHITAAMHFDEDTWKRNAELEKGISILFQIDYSKPATKNLFYLKEFNTWQWWKLMSLFDGWQLGSGTLRNSKFEALKKTDPLWTSLYDKLKTIWMPVDYTRDIVILNEEYKLSYFTEDVSWNAYWYYLNMDYYMHLDAKEFGLDKDRRGEWWIYNVQQMLARYNMERLSQGLGNIEKLSWHGIAKAGYDPQLIAFNGRGFSNRKNYWDVQSSENLDLLHKIVDIERRIDDAIASGRFVMKDGSVIELTKPESIEYIGNLMHGNIDVLDQHFFGYWLVFATEFLSGVQYLDFDVPPSVMMNYETMLRDPLTYSVLKIAVEKFYKFKNQLAPYTKEELLLPGVKIVDVAVSKLLTYFDLVDVDVTTLLNEKKTLVKNTYDWDKSILFRQQRLNHKPFHCNMTILSEKVQEVVIRMFIGPEFDEYGQKLTFESNRENFVEIDKFIHSLIVGENLIYRSSDDFDWTSSDPHTYSELYNYHMMAYLGKSEYDFQPNISESHSLFPDRLVLPHGWVEGMPMAMFFMISPYTAEHRQFATYDHTYLSGIGSGVRHIDSVQFGYPLDRRIDDFYEFLVPNMFFATVKVYHEEKIDKYYPTTIDNLKNLGFFDEDF